MNQPKKNLLFLFSYEKKRETLDCFVSQVLCLQVLLHFFEKTRTRLTSRRPLKMQAILVYNEIVVAKVRTKTSPQSIYHLRIKSMPEVGVQFLSSIEEVQHIIEPIGFVYLHASIMWNFDERGTSRGIFSNNFSLCPSRDTLR